MEEEEDGELPKTGIRFTGMSGKDLKSTFYNSRMAHMKTLVFWWLNYKCGIAQS